MPTLRQKKLLFLAASLAFLTGGIFIFLQTNNSSPIAFPAASPNPHVAGDPKTSLKNVRAKIIYFTPGDIASSTEWAAKIDGIMKEEKKFFLLQLNSNLIYDLYPGSMIGSQNHTFYDSDQTNHGNPHALITIRKEIMSRIFSKNGGLFKPEFSRFGPEYNIIIIVYEGAGASALIYKNGRVSGEDAVIADDDGPPAIILSTAFLISPLYREFGSSVLAHEIGHTFGLNDGYNLATGALTGSDIMGEGRRRVLSETFISKENKQTLGLK